MFSIICGCLALACFLTLALLTWRDAHDYKVPFGRQYLSPKTQIVVLLWLGVSLVGNLIFAIRFYLGV